MQRDNMPQTYERPVVEVVDAERLIESVGAQAATSVTGFNGITHLP